ncbi:MAG: hypothetical protein K2X76_15260 [Sphingomonas sp.]|nr:hypothetical protein [Sphingomonas sp.]
MLGMTMGTYHHHHEGHYETVLDWENLVEREVYVVDHEAGWEPGAFSVVMPRVRESVCAEITVEVGDELIPLARFTNGSVYMTEQQVARWCGPVDPSTHRKIAPQPIGRRYWKDQTPAGAPKAPAGREALMMTADQMRAYADACAAAAEAHNAAMAAAIDAPCPEPAPLAPAEAPPAIEAPVEAMAAPCPITGTPVAPENADAISDTAPGVAALWAMVQALSERLAVVEAGRAGVMPEPAVVPDGFAAPVEAPAPLPADPRARGVVEARDARRGGRTAGERAAIVRAWQARRQARERADLDRRALLAANGAYQGLLDQFAARGADLAAAQAEIETLRAQLLQAHAQIDRERERNRIAIDTEEALMRARARGDRLARHALGQRTKLARAAIDLRGARAEAGVLRRRLAQATAPVSTQAPEPRGTMAVAFKLVRA